MTISQAAIDEVKTRFFEQGISIKEWSETNGFEEHLVYAILSGKGKARRGKSHLIAVALGLKPTPETSLFPPGEIEKAES